jgi:hypothetical protein
MVQHGFRFEIGRHNQPLRGYYAVFHKEGESTWTCSECNQSELGWMETGHALTPHRAVVMAAKIALKRPVQVPGLEEFKGT